MRITDFQHKWQRIAEVADRVVARQPQLEVDASEQTGSDVVFNCTVQTPAGAKGVHGFWLHAAGAHVARLRADPVVVASVVPGRTMIDRDLGVFRVKRADMSPCGAWVVVTLGKVL